MEENTVTPPPFEAPPAEAAVPAAPPAPEAPHTPSPPTADVLGTITGVTADALREALANAEAAGYLRGRADALAAADAADTEPAEPPFPVYHRRSIWD